MTEPGKTPMAQGRFLVGIDLGTTNCSLCYADLQEATPLLRQFAIPQLVAPGETAAEPLLPSFCYLPGGSELPEGALALPWGTPPFLVGRFAREQGAAVPDRLVSSAKSWLAHAGVARRNPILPWGSELGKQMLSPVQASRAYLEHLRNAWNQVFANVLDDNGDPCLLEDQNVVITVPASFDETARELTLEAARGAGLRNLTLLEEPLAAFYCWLSAHPGDWQALVPAGAKVLVVDVGGGTTDFSLVELEQGGVLRRTAVGNHLLLGGDNVDMALARKMETAWGTRLSQRQWSRLCQECRRAKEHLLSEHAPEQLDVHLAGTGSSLLASMKTARLSREEVVSFVLDGFFPMLPVNAPDPERRRGLQELGLPYASDPAVTRHILQFLRASGDFVRPTHVLFNGGSMLPSLLRERVLDCLEHWSGTRPAELLSPDLSLAVSVGATYYGLARLGRAVRVKGGIARALYLKVGGVDGVVCVMPRDTEEGVVRTLDGQSFRLRTNQPVAFPLFSSTTRLGDALGALVPEEDSLVPLPPLTTILKYGRKGAPTEVGTTLSSMLDVTGLLQMWCDVPDTGHRFPLTFDLRGTASNAPQTVVAQEDEEAGHRLLEEAFTCAGETALATLPTRMEEVLGTPRLEWSSALLRRFADCLLEHRDWRLRSAAHEARWLNLCGFCLRPGFGFAGDEWRIGEAWKLWLAGPTFPKQNAVLAQWHVFWRRIAPGLRPGQQNQLFASVTKGLLRKDGGNAVRANDQPGLEAWRLAASLEAIPHPQKRKLLEALLLHSGRLDDAMFWPITRLAARKLFHGPQDAILPAARWEPLLDALTDRVNQSGNTRNGLFALANTSRLTGLRTIDVSEPKRRTIARYLEKRNSPWSNLPLELQDDDDSLRTGLLGEQLPLGLQVSQE
ncbi:MAG: Hsp70 family protein [Victivallales bacterium]|nr:Hsp70 family protein [Victivallales bacterium]